MLPTDGEPTFQAESEIARLGRMRGHHDRSVYADFREPNSLLVSCSLRSFSHSSCPPAVSRKFLGLSLSSAPLVHCFRSFVGSHISAFNCCKSQFRERVLQSIFSLQGYGRFRAYPRVDERVSAACALTGIFAFANCSSLLVAYPRRNAVNSPVQETTCCGLDMAESPPQLTCRWQGLCVIGRSLYTFLCGASSSGRLRSTGQRYLGDQPVVDRFGLGHNVPTTERIHIPKHL
jgi:hypothetical protein